MAIYPGAIKRLIPKHNRVAIARYRRMNLHVAVSNGTTLFHYFSKESVCSHFYVRKDGIVEQYIDTKYRSAADLNGNDSTISVETAGGVKNANGEKWTEAQLVSLVKLWIWARDTHKIKNQLAKNTQTNDNSAGLSHHRLGVEGNFSNRPGVLSTSWKPGGIKYSLARGKECPGDAKILQIKSIFDRANGSKTPDKVVKPVATKPSTPSKPNTSTKKWPEVQLKVTDSHTTASHEAWVKLLADVGYKNKDLSVNFQNWLKKLGYYKGKVDGSFGSMSVKALQSFLKSKRVYNGLIDGKRQSMTVKAEISYLNSQAKLY